MPSPRISVLILTYNRPQLIGRAIHSVIQQDYQDWEIVVVHDGPNQETAAVMHEWQTRDRRIRYYHRSQPGNIAEATNFGLAQAHGEYVAILDDDDYWAATDKLGLQIKFLDEHPDYVACGGGAIVIDQNNTETLRYFKPEHDLAIKRHALLANPMVHSTLLYRRAMALSVGGYHETLAGFQDWEFVLKLGLSGKLYNFPAYFLNYCLWQGSGSFQQQTKNTRSAITIVRSYRRRYAHATAALVLARLYHTYAHLPVFVRSRSYTVLARLKKRLAQRRPVRAPASRRQSIAPVEE